MKVKASRDPSRKLCGFFNAPTRADGIRRLLLLLRRFVRPGYIQPLHGIKSRTGWVRGLYAVVGPIYPLLKMVAPRSVTTTEGMGRAMIEVAKNGWPNPILEAPEINAAAERSG
jgi:hypothetical protein